MAIGRWMHIPNGMEQFAPAGAGIDDYDLICLDDCDVPKEAGTLSELQVRESTPRLEDIFTMLIRPNCVLPSKPVNDKEARLAQVIWLELNVLAW